MQFVVGVSKISSVLVVEIFLLHGEPELLALVPYASWELGQVQMKLLYHHVRPLNFNNQYGKESTEVN